MITAPRHVLALVEPGRYGATAVAHARLIALSKPTRLTVVTLATQATGPRCGTSILDYNTAIAEAASEDLGRAREDLADVVAPITYTVLPQRDKASLGWFVTAGAFDLVLLPNRRRRPGALRHPDADRLAARTTAEIRVVGPLGGRGLKPARAVSCPASRR